MRDELNPARVLGRVGRQLREVLRRQDAAERVGANGLQRLGVADVVNTDMWLRRWAVKFVAIGRRGVLQPAPGRSSDECLGKL